MAIVKQKIKIGELLVSSSALTQEQLNTAVERHKQTGQRLGQDIVELGFLTTSQFLSYLSQQLQIPFVDLRRYNFDVSLIHRMRESYARRYRAIVLADQNGLLLVGMADPMDIFASDELERILEQPIQPALVDEAELLSTLDLVYRRTEEIAGFAEELDEELTDGQFDLEALGLEADDSDAPVVKLLQSIFEDAVQVRASDIHIEPDENVLRIRQRVDGILQEQVMKERRIAPALVLRLTMPIEAGESVVMRLLDQTGGATDLNEVGMPEDMLKVFRNLIHRPHGLILVTGPTGSGKTTTLYGALQELNEVGKKIITVEDPVEYRLHRVNQVQVNPKIDLSFARILRSALRQDPDILLVGEIRDTETAEIALRAAMTGHMVLSTLHTNDAVSSAMRLVDMGAEGFLAATALRAVVAQRLVRKLCDNCFEDHQPDVNDAAWVKEQLGEKAEGVKFKKALGCHRCNNSGYRGRIGVFEILVLNEALADALRRSDASAFVKIAKRTPGYKPLVVGALEFAVQGITSLEEVFRVAEQIDESSDFMDVAQ
jgi:MSHA biogenesis protein MshE